MGKITNEELLKNIQDQFADKVTVVGEPYGLLTLETVKGSPMESSWPKHIHNNILHAQLVSDAITILGSDMIEQDGLTVGNNVTLALVCKTDFEIENYFIKLSHEGTIKYPIHDFYGGKIAGIIDKFGVHWLLKL